MDTLPIPVDTLPTPNPDALMFRVADPFVERGTYEYRSENSADDAALPRRLFTLDGVHEVLVSTRFVTVNKDPDYSWPELVSAIKGLIREHINSGDPAVPADQMVQAIDVTSELARKVVAILDEDIRPAVAQDGGDIQFVGITEANVVQVRLIGSCSSCPSATATLAFGIERMLMEDLPEITGVEQV